LLSRATGTKPRETSLFVSCVVCVVTAFLL
jgi:hypothetical protein